MSDDDYNNSYNNNINSYNNNSNSYNNSYKSSIIQYGLDVSPFKVILSHIEVIFSHILFASIVIKSKEMLFLKPEQCGTKGTFNFISHSIR